MNDMGKRITYALNANGWNQKRLADTLHVTAGAISGFCTGKFDPSARTISDICDALGINEEWLRTGEGPMKRETPKTIIEELARAYNLTPAVTRLLDAIAQAFVELPEDVAQQIVDRLRAALAEEDEAAWDASAVRSAIDAEGPEETGPGVKEKNQAE